MVETAIENRICQTCGAEVRPNTLFCYNCGKSVAPEIVQDLPRKRDGGDVEFRENNAPGQKNDLGQTESTVLRETIDEPIPILSEEPKLKSAAAMRRQPKSVQPKRVEIIWEEHANAPNGWFILAAILLTLFAFGILYLTAYYK